MAPDTGSVLIYLLSNVSQRIKFKYVLWKTEQLKTVLRQLFGSLDCCLECRMMMEIQFKLVGLVRYWAKRRPGINGSKEEFGSLSLLVDCCSLA